MRTHALACIVESIIRSLITSPQDMDAKGRKNLQRACRFLCVCVLCIMYVCVYVCMYVCMHVCMYEIL